MLLPGVQIVLASFDMNYNYNSFSVWNINLNFFVLTRKLCGMTDCPKLPYILKAYAHSSGTQLLVLVQTLILPSILMSFCVSPSTKAVVAQ